MTSLPRFLASEVALTELTANELRARVARAQMYLLLMRPVDGAPAPSQQQARDHLAYLYKLEMDGRLYGCGSVGPGPNEARYELAIVVAASREQADLYAAQEPLQKAGLVRTEVRGHTINEGVACYVARAMAKRVAAGSDSFDPDIRAIALSHDELAGRAQKAQLHLISLKPTQKPRPQDDTQTGHNHFLWLRDNEMQAKLMSCGPLEPLEPLGPGIWGPGLGVVATARDQAEHIASIEPSGLEGYRSLSVRPWTLDYGLAAPIAKALVDLNRLPAQCRRLRWQQTPLSCPLEAEESVHQSKEPT